MSLPRAVDPQDPNKDELTRTLGQFGLEASHLNRLEEAARLFERLEWKIARRIGPGSPDSGGSEL